MNKSQELYSRAKKIIPGVSQLLSKRPDMFSAGVWPVYYEKAKGAEIWDLDGKRYTDMSISGIGANVLGYSDPDVDRAVRKAVAAGSSSSLNCPEEVWLAELMCELHPWASKVRFARSGGEAMAVAVRIARARTGKDRVIFCGYHGWHDWYLAANLRTKNALGEHLLPGLSPSGVPRALKGTSDVFSYNSLESLDRAICRSGSDLAAIIMEPLRSSYPEKGFLEGVRRMASRARSVLIFDEISSGFRLNAGGVHMLFKVEPDIAVFSKAMGNGYPIAAIIGKAKVMDAAQDSFISSTMWTERVGPSAALATVKKIRDKKVYEHLVKIGKLMQRGWLKISENSGIALDVSGIYPSSHFNFRGYEQALEMKAFFIQEMLEQGFLASNLFYATYSHRKKHVEDYLKVAEGVFARMARLIDKGKLKKALKGAPSTSGFRRLN